MAIAITRLIIEIGGPHVTGDESLGKQIADLWPSYGAYTLSFAIIGIYWANHHSFLELFRRTDHTFLMLNVLFLMAIAFLPFPTAVLGEYLTEGAQRADAVTFYSFGACSCHPPPGACCGSTAAGGGFWSRGWNRPTFAWLQSSFSHRSPSTGRRSLSHSSSPGPPWPSALALHFSTCYRRAGPCLPRGPASPERHASLTHSHPDSNLIRYSRRTH